MRKPDTIIKYSLLAAEIGLALQMGCQSLVDRISPRQSKNPDMGIAILKCDPQVSMLIISREQSNRLQVLEVYNQTQDQRGVVAVSPKPENGTFYVASDEGKFKSNNGDIGVQEGDILEATRYDANSAEVTGKIGTQVTCK